MKFSTKQLSTVICLALALGTIAVYCPVMSHQFVNYDDPDYILDNPHVKGGLTWPGIVWAFKSGHAANWHPLTWMSHMLDCQLFGLNPAGHHLVNVLFHTANTVLLFILLNYMTGAIWRSAFVAALFAWHPLHVESVAWASERKDVLSAFFWMLTLLCYARYARGRQHADGRWKTEESSSSSIIHPKFSLQFYFFSLFFFACGLMSKPMVVTLPFVLLLLDFWPLRRLEPLGHGRGSAAFQLIIEKAPFFALMAGSCVITLLVQHNAMWSTAALPFQFRFANTLMSYVRYLSKLFVPAKLALIYPYPHSWPALGVAAAGIVLFALTVIFVIQAKRFPYLSVGWFWFLGTLIPVIGLVQVGVQSMADRYTYLPSIGIFILVTWGISDLVASAPWRTRACALSGGCALIACLVLTSIQLSYWRNDITLFTHTVVVTTGNYAAYDCLGKSWQRQGRLDHAEQCYEEAVQLEPDYPLAQFDLGMNLVALGHPADASNHLATAVQLWPGNATIQYDFGVFLSQHGQTQDAVSHLKAALAIRPDFPEARRELDSLDVEMLKR